jgi:ketosteroid isomerase-like protein
MLDVNQARQIASSWIDAWNSHDLDRILAHYTDDFEITSPMIARITGDSSCCLRGKNAVGAYWAKALQHVPDLRFELIDVLVGATSITIYYRSVLETRASEVIWLNDAGLIERAVVHYDQV